ncbi:AbrB/MazE/SpoVT family DNA-binding domain-containing protein [Candidatus Parcubacteria bacterium]|nr:AbrB/MazE/SpoVT family DNA-binding domain-containing protein [Candidatus Parcubacteria bacterium]
MPTQKLQNHNIRKLSKVAGGNSFSVTLPIEYVRKLKWKEKQKLIVELKARHLIIKGWKK